MANRKQIAEWLQDDGGDAGLETDGQATGPELTRVSGLEDASENTVVFAAAQSLLDTALAGQAGLILTRPECTVSSPVQEGRLLRVADPRLGFAVIAQRLAPTVPGHVDPTATVHPTAQIGQGSRIGPGAVIAASVRMGQHCNIGARVVIEAGVLLGDRVQVQAGAVLGSLGFGYARKPDGSYVLFPQQGSLVIGDDVEIGANSTIDRGALGETRIGAGTKIDNLVHIGHNCHIGRNVILAAQTGISGSTVVEDGAILGGQVGIGEHAVVGPGVILGGGAGVLSGKKLRGPGQVFWGRPAQPLKQYLRDLARLRKEK